MTSELPHQDDSWVVVDDANPRLTYSGSWDQLSDAPGLLDHTAHKTNDPQATITFNFTGTVVAVYGAVQNSQDGLLVESTYALDGSSDVYSYGLDAANTNSNEQESMIYGVLFYQSPVLSNSEHTLIIANDAEVSPNDTYLWIDYIAYMPLMDSGATSSGSSLRSATILSPTIMSSSWASTSSVAFITSSTKPIISLSLSSMFTSTSVSGLTTTSTTTPKINGFDTQHHTNVTAIIGIAAGSTVLLIVGLALFHFLRKRWQHLRGDAGARAPIEPFIRSHLLMMPITEPSKGNNTLTEGNPEILHATISDPTRIESLPIINSASISPFVPSPALPVNTAEFSGSQDAQLRQGNQLAIPVLVQPHLHEDGGVSLLGGPLQDAPLENDIIDIPPAYTQY